ncbi:MAG: sulfatase [Saprospiraceae bacterium]|nr:sulfatase [Saprospiraceae bacterium]
MSYKTHHHSFGQRHRFPKSLPTIPLILKYLPLAYLLTCVACSNQIDREADADHSRPNILFAISDDQSFPYASFLGDESTITPAFDAIAARGVVFNQAFCAAPQCSPSRAALLTGRNIWQLEEAGTHGSYFPRKYPVFTNALEASGYALGFTGKPWGPGNWKDAGWDRNPVGPEFNEHTMDVPYKGINKRDYARNFTAFLDAKPTGQPFFFWYGGHEPHRVFEEGSGLRSGKKLANAAVPNFLPQDSIVQSDILDYSAEIQWFDRHLGQMIDALDERGLLEQTIIVITADNGMAFPAAKANLTEYGVHVPLVIAGPGIKGQRRVDDLVSLIDLAPTFLELADVQALKGITGRSLGRLLTSEKEGYVFDRDGQLVVVGRERHTHARPNNFGYPARAVRTPQHLYIYNMKPDRWPAGDPERTFPPRYQRPEDFKSMAEGYHDIDPAPSKTLILKEREKYADYFDLAVAKRPEAQLFDIINDPGCTKNLALDPRMHDVKSALHEVLIQTLKGQADPRMFGEGDIFESYPRFGGMRDFPGFKERGAYNPTYQVAEN